MHIRGVIDFASSVLLVVIAGAVAMNLLRQSGPPSANPQEMTLPTRPVSLAEAPVVGSSASPLVLLQFDDFECDYCQRFVRDVLPGFESRYVAPGIVRIAYRHFPISEIHPRAVGLALAATCAGEQGHFWDAYKLLHLDARPDRLDTLAEHLGINPDRHAKCVERTKVSALDEDRRIARELGVVVTPTFILGVPTKDDEMRALEIVLGAAPLSTFDRAIARALETSGRR